MAIRESLRDARKRAGMSIDLLSEMMGFSREHGSNIEHGHTNLQAHHLLKMSQLIEFTDDEFADLWDQAKVSKFGLRRITERIMRPDIINDPNKILQLIEFSETISTQ